MNPDQIVQEAAAAGVRLVRMLYCDNGGVIRGKLCHIDRLKSRLKGGIGLTVAMQAFNMLDHLVPYPGMGPVGEIRLVQAEYLQDWLTERLEASNHKQAAWRTDPARSGAGAGPGLPINWAVVTPDV